LVVRWGLTLSATEFRFARSRWSCEAAAHNPMIRPKDPDGQEKLFKLQALLMALSANETAVFMDEVAVNMKPKTGCRPAAIVDDRQRLDFWRCF
jgi:hypothetical protein